MLSLIFSTKGKMIARRRYIIPFPHGTPQMILIEEGSDIKIYLEQSRMYDYCTTK
jgi:hypothetical protein